MYYLVNATDNQRLSIGNKTVKPGESLDFTKLTAEIKLALERGSIRAYNKSTGFPEEFAGYTVQEVLTALDPAIAASLPPHLRTPVVTYALVTPAPPGDPLENYVPDAVLRGLLNNQLGIFKAAELSYYTHPIRLVNQGITNARGLENATHLEELDLSQNDIAEIGDFSRMQKLRILDLSSNDVNTLAGLIKLKKLEQIRVAGNALTSLGSIRFMQNLNEIDIRNNLFDQTGIDNLVVELWQNRYELGRRNAIIRLEGNAAPSATSIQKIEGTGGFEFEGLKQTGCVITYEAG